MVKFYGIGYAANKIIEINMFDSNFMTQTYICYG